MTRLAHLTEQTEAPASGRSTEFIAVDAGTEQYSGAKLLVAAYVLVWLVLMGWIFLLWQKQRKLAQKLDDLESTLARTAKQQGRSREASAPVATPDETSQAHP